MTRAIAAAVAVCALTAAPGFAQAVDWPRQSPPAALAPHHVQFPPYQIRTLPNGLRVIVVPHHEEPAVSFRLVVRAGAMEEPADRPGVASFVAGLLQQGTMTKSADEIASLVDSAGGLFTVGSGNELTYIQGAVIKDQTDRVLSLIADMVEHPAFAPAEIALQRDQAVSSLRVGYDDPDYLATLVFERLVFGAHPYGRPSDGTPDSIGRLTREDLAAFHRTWFVPNNALLAVVGDLSAGDLLAAAVRAFGGWERRDVPAVSVIGPPAPSARLVIVDRPGSAQTEIRVGHIGIRRTHPDLVPFDLAIRILGGEGANRLFGVLRSDRGLTYGASAELHAYERGGEVVAETNTRTASTAETLRLVVNEFARLQREPVGEAELQGAQDFIAGNFALTIETPSDIAEQVLTRLFYGQDPSEIQTYLDLVAQVTPGDIQRVARDLLKPDELSMVLVGDAAGFVDALRAAGFTNYERIPLADLDLDSPTLQRTGSPSPGAGPATNGVP